MKMLYKIIPGSILLVALSAGGPVYSEVIKLKDGQVLKGEITAQNQYSITVKTRYQVRLVPRTNILSIEKGHDGLERLYILTRDDELIEGFLVEEDSRIVAYKITEDSPQIKTISKLDVLKMSENKIRPVDLEFRFKPGAFFPLNTGGSNLGIAPIYMGSIGTSSIIVRRLRVVLETGYSRAENNDNAERYLQVTPILLSPEYRFKLYRGLEVSPRIGGGIAMVEYKDGEGDEFSGNIITGIIGFNFSYTLRHRFSIGIFTDYLMLLDSSGLLNTVMTGVCLGYRL